MNSKQHGRRRFLREGAALAGLAVGGVRLANGQPLGPETDEARSRDLHAYGERSRFEKSIRVNMIYGPRTPIQDSVGIITPGALHYEDSHGHAVPDIDPKEHRLLIHGLVNRPLIFTMEDLKRLPSVTRVHFLECRANSNPSRPERKGPDATAAVTHGLMGCSEWTGVPLSLLLKEAGVKKGASWIIAQGAETGNHTKSIPMGKAMDDILMVYGQNGEAVRPEQGYPLRLLCPGWQGINNVKWVKRIKVVNQPYMMKMEINDYTEVRPDGNVRWFESELGVKSVITRPSGGHQLQGRGYYEISGLAWTGGGTIRRVEVSTDAGKTWKDAEMQQPVHRKAHTRFRFGWNWNGEEAVLMSRSTDDRGEVQPDMAELARIWSVPADYFQKINYTFGNFNAIQPWKVTRDGSVQNALFA